MNTDADEEDIDLVETNDKFFKHLLGGPGHHNHDSFMSSDNLVIIKRILASRN